MHVYCSISGHNEEAWVECLDEVKPRVSGRRITKGIRSGINRNPTLIPLYNAHYLILSWPRLSATIRQIRYDSIVDGTELYVHRIDMDMETGGVGPCSMEDNSFL